MGIFKSWTDRIKEKKDMRIQYENQDRILTNIENRKLSPVEREYNRFVEEDKQKRLKVAVEKYRIQRKHDAEFNHNALNAPNVVAGPSTILKQKNLFKVKR